MMGLPPLDTFIDLMENYLEANFHFSFNTPHIFFTLHVKAPGIKAFKDKVASL